MKIVAISTKTFATCLAAISLTSAGKSHAALIESLPFNGSLIATTGTDAVAVNNPVATTGFDGSANGAMAFQRISYYGTYATVPDGGGLSGASTGTISMDVRWNGIQNQTANESLYGPVTGRQVNGTSSDDVIALNGADPNLSEISFMFNPQSGISLTGSTPVGDGVWHDLSITFTPTSENLYLDGNLDASITGTFGANSVNDADLSIGAWVGDAAGYSNSDIANFQVFDTVETPQQLAQLSTAAVPEPTLLGLIAATGTALLARRRRV